MNQLKNIIVEKNPSIFCCLETRVDKNTLDNRPQLYACFQLGLFPKNQGLTIANALRRTLLTESTECSITGVLIENIKHEYSNLKGSKETIFDILLNLKKLIFFSRKTFFKTQVSFLSEKGPIILKAKNLKLPTFLFCVNPDQYIATLETNSKINMTIFIDQSTPKNFSYFTDQYYMTFSNNFFPFKLKKKIIRNQHSNFLFLDSQFCPICNLNYKIAKKESKKELIFLEIWTNGSVHPNFILKKAIKNLIINLIPLYSLKTGFRNFQNNSNKKILSQKKFIQKFIKLDLTNFPISLETYQSLKNLNILTIGDLYILKIKKNFPNALTHQEFLEIQRLFKYLKFYFLKTINSESFINYKK
uniref:Plastid-encoded RNA polymerase subunit alpha n=1 Tax=Bryopsis sp. HV04063 TaxID=1979421 RepID=A0A2P0QH41_9CHLO|nr:RNA polymerase a-subunit [Bryopsis sp. HV04063]ARO74086.1 RNA polymerase a-subunit [Bryopsis sp. HV04063]